MRLSSALFFGLAIAACGGAPVTAPSSPPSPVVSLPAGFSQVTAMCAHITSCARPYDPPSAR
ncbi:MAG: hypothetical protein ABI461_13015, partial [Polyangiaceae bacterium]